MNLPSFHIRVDFNEACSVGPGKIALLEALRDAGSLTQAARALGMSYRRAWLLLESINSSFREPSAHALVGGRGGGGVRLTPFGIDLIAAYRALEADVQARGARHFAELGPAARGASGAARRRSVRASKRP
jgi:molybdate transport system regulatory protein